jgi:glycosyltransferase involved in cell wall biosynthesis
VITSVGSGTQEVAGDAALLVDPAHTDALSQALHTLLDQSSLQEQYRKQGLERAKRCSWAATAGATRALLERF